MWKLISLKVLREVTHIFSFTEKHFFKHEGLCDSRQKLAIFASCSSVFCSSVISDVVDSVQN